MSEMVENAIIYLIREDRFYAEFIQRMKKIVTTDVETAGIAVDTGGIYLLINPYFLEDLALSEAAEVMKHECEHLLRDHFDREKTLEPDLNKENESLLDKFKKMSTSYFLNIAEDYAINETLHNLPEKFRIFDKNGHSVKDKKTGKEVFASPAKVDDLVKMFPYDNIERNQAFEYYYRFIKRKAKAGEFTGKNGNYLILPMDDHNKLAKALNEIDKDFTKEIVKRAAQEAKQMAGQVPGHIEVLLDNLNKKTKNWKEDLQIFNARCSSIEQDSTNKRRNRRYGLLYPGSRAKIKSHLAIAIDTSASVNNDQLSQFGAELNSIYENGIDITVIECDIKVNRVYKFEPNTRFNVVGRGGTAFKPVFDLIESFEFSKEYGEVDGLIYLTDGDNYDAEEIIEPSFQILWALLPNGKVSYRWGEKTYIEVSK
jgi:predicted metal-dependent peptidase